VVGKSAANTGDQETKAESCDDSGQVKTSGDIAEPVGEWCEASTPEGYTYYWNTVTKGETLLVFVCHFSHVLFKHCSWFLSDFLVAFLLYLCGLPQISNH